MPTNMNKASIQTSLHTAQQQLTAWVAAKAGELQSAASRKIAGAVLSANQKKALAVVGSAGVVYAVYAISRRYLSNRSAQACESALSAMSADGRIHLLVLPRTTYAPSLSAACTRVEAFLRVNRIPYEREVTLDATAHSLPLLVYRGRRITTPEAIIEFLSTELRVWHDARISNQDRTLAVALKRAVDFSMDCFYARVLYLEDITFGADMMQSIADTPRMPGFLARYMVRRTARIVEANQTLTAFNAMTFDQAQHQFLATLAAIEDTLSNNPNPDGFLFNTAPVTLGSASAAGGEAVVTSVDCAVYARLLPIVNLMHHARATRPASFYRCKAFRAVVESPILLRYITRMTQACFPELKDGYDALFHAAREAGRKEEALPDAQEEEAVEVAAEEEEVVEEVRMSVDAIDESEVVERETSANTDKSAAVIVADVAPIIEMADENTA